MITRPLLAATLAVLSMLTACGGGQAEETTAQVRTRTASVDAGNVAAPAIGGIGGSGLTANSVGGIGVAAPAIGGIGGSGYTTEGIVVAAPAIGGIGGSGAIDASVGTACGLSGVDVTIVGVRLNQSATAGADDAGWVDVALPAPLRVNLLALSTGASIPLALAALPDGTYAQARLLLAANDAGAPLANSLVGAAGEERALSVAGAARDGLRLKTTIQVDGGRVSGSWAASAVCDAVASGAAATY